MGKRIFEFLKGSPRCGPNSRSDKVDEDLSGKVMEFLLEIEKMSIVLLDKIQNNVNKYMGNFGEWIEKMYALFSTKLVLQDQAY